MKFSAASNPPPPWIPTVLGFDPGRDKCGVAVMTGETLHYHQVVPALAAIATLDHLIAHWRVDRLVLGDQTTAKQWRSRLTQDLQSCPPLTLVDERYTTLEARDRYWQMYPPQGLTRLLPPGLRHPPRPIDDIVAILLIERYRSRLASSQESGLIP